MHLLEIKPIDLNSKDYLIEKDLRETILRKPLNLMLSDEDLRYDHLFMHMGAYYDNQLIGLCLYREVACGVVQIKQVCVHPRLQGHRIGKELMMKVEERIKKEGYTSIMLHARKNAWSFYEKLDYEFYGDEFYEVGIKHREMRKILSNTR